LKRRSRGRILLIRRKYVAAAALILAVIGIFTIINHPAIVGVSGRQRTLPIYSVEREDRTMSLSFNTSDTGDAHTLQILQILNAADVRATFFVTGNWVRQNEELAAKLAESGHELMNLSDDHSLLRRMTAAEIIENLEACNTVIETATGTRPTIFRAPYGGYDDKLIHLAASMGLRTVQWSIDSGDWRISDPQAIVRQVQNRAFPGGIVLMHSNLAQTAAALHAVIEGLQADGYTLIPVSELVLDCAYTTSITGRQIPV